MTPHPAASASQLPPPSPRKRGEGRRNGGATESIPSAPKGERDVVAVGRDRVRGVVTRQGPCAKAGLAVSLSRRWRLCDNERCNGGRSTAVNVGAAGPVAAAHSCSAQRWQLAL